MCLLKTTAECFSILCTHSNFIVQFNSELFGIDNNSDVFGVGDNECVPHWDTDKWIYSVPLGQCDMQIGTEKYDRPDLNINQQE